MDEIFTYSASQHATL